MPDIDRALRNLFDIRSQHERDIDNFIEDSTSVMHPVLRFFVLIFALRFIIEVLRKTVDTVCSTREKPNEGIINDRSSEKRRRKKHDGCESKVNDECEVGDNALSTKFLRLIDKHRGLEPELHHLLATNLAFVVQNDPTILLRLKTVTDLVNFTIGPLLFSTETDVEHKHLQLVLGPSRGETIQNDARLP